MTIKVGDRIPEATLYVMSDQGPQAVKASEFFKGKFPVDKPHEFIVVDLKMPLKQMVEHVKGKLDGKIFDTEVAINLISGTGKEHMAVLSAALKLGLGIRLVAYTGKETEEI